MSSLTRELKEIKTLRMRSRVLSWVCEQIDDDIKGDKEHKGDKETVN